MRVWRALEATLRALQPEPVRGCCCFGVHGPEDTRVQTVIPQSPAQLEQGTQN